MEDDKEIPKYITPGEGFADIELSRAYSLGGVDQRTVRMREPTVTDQLALDAIKGGDAAKEITFMANLCELTPDDIKKLSLRDYKRLQSTITVFSD